MVLGADRMIEVKNVTKEFEKQVSKKEKIKFFLPNILFKKKSKNDNKTLFIDASNEFVKANNNNLLSPENINKIVKIFENRENVENIARLVSNTEISEKEYNLSVSAYVETEDTTIKVDINKSMIIIR